MLSSESSDYFSLLTRASLCAPCLYWAWPFHWYAKSEGFRICKGSQSKEKTNKNNSTTVFVLVRYTYQSSFQCLLILNHKLSIVNIQKQLAPCPWVIQIWIVAKGSFSRYSVSLHCVLGTWETKIPSILVSTVQARRNRQAMHPFINVLVTGEWWECVLWGKELEGRCHAWWGRGDLITFKSE